MWIDNIWLNALSTHAGQLTRKVLWWLLPPHSSDSGPAPQRCSRRLSKLTKQPFGPCEMAESGSSVEFSGSLASSTLPPPRTRIFKIIVIGDSGVGKTCLTYRFCAGRFPEKTEATIGVDFRERLVDIDGEKIKVCTLSSERDTPSRCFVCPENKSCAHNKVRKTGLRPTWKLTHQQLLHMFTRSSPWGPELFRCSRLQQALTLYLARRYNVSGQQIIGCRVLLCALS